MASTSHERWMRLALDEAQRGIGYTSPNPSVGSVIVQNDQLIGKGFHQKAGGPHAEINAISSALSDGHHLQGASLYVTLEPCSTAGRTPPCTRAIIEAGISEVIYGSSDANPAHRGAADEVLRNARIRVIHGILKAECDHLNAPFFKWIQTGRPWVILKAGLSLDGRLTRPPSESQWLTSPASREHAQDLRKRADSILVGAETIRTDNPQLTYRAESPKGLQKQPLWRIILTQSGVLPEEALVFNDALKSKTKVFKNLAIPCVLDTLGKLETMTLLVEGGAKIGNAFWDAGLVDEIHFYVAPMLNGGPISVLSGAGRKQHPLHSPAYKQIGDDLWISARV